MVCFSGFVVTVALVVVVVGIVVVIGRLWLDRLGSGGGVSVCC